MSDINRNKGLMSLDGELKKKHLEIQVNEKLSQIASLKLRLEDLRSIEEKRVKLQIEMLEKEISQMTAQDVEIIEQT